MRRLALGRNVPVGGSADAEGMTPTTPAVVPAQAGTHIPEAGGLGSPLSRGRQYGGSALDPAQRPPRQIMEHTLLHEDYGEIGDASDHGQHEDRDKHHRGIRLAFAEG